MRCLGIAAWALLLGHCWLELVITAAAAACWVLQDAEESRQTLGRLKRMAGFEAQDFDPVVGVWAYM